jgi:hypothetical protein
MIVDEITPAMIEAGTEEYGLFDACDRPEWVVCAVYRAMAAASLSRQVEHVPDNDPTIA